MNEPLPKQHPINCRVDVEFYQRIQTVQKRLGGVSISDTVRFLLNEGLSRYEKVLKGEKL